MFNPKDLLDLLRSNYEASIQLNHNEKLQLIIDTHNNEIITFDIIKNLVPDWFVIDVFYNYQYPSYYNSSYFYLLKIRELLNKDYKNFNYVYCNFKQYEQRMCFIYPLVFDELLYSRIIKINELKVFL